MNCCDDDDGGGGNDDRDDKNECETLNNAEEPRHNMTFGINEECLNYIAPTTEVSSKQILWLRLREWKMSDEAVVSLISGNGTNWLTQLLNESLEYIYFTLSEHSKRILWQNACHKFYDHVNVCCLSHCREPWHHLPSNVNLL